ncbi:MAG: recombinase family protein [Nitratireductor sp.]|nr:recombinase family protein [Nitratireductor sp.]
MRDNRRDSKINSKVNSEVGRLVRCAIYTRKSSEEGLEQEFNSLHAQREACEAYIASQRHEGWRVIASDYDDGGFSGGSMERPALKRLIDDLKSGQIDCVVVYKIDRVPLAVSLMHVAPQAVDLKDMQRAIEKMPVVSVGSHPPSAFGRQKPLMVHSLSVRSGRAKNAS